MGEISCDTDVRGSWHLASVTLPTCMHALETRLPLSGACGPDLGLCTPDLGHACARRACNSALRESRSARVGRILRRWVAWPSSAAQHLCSHSTGVCCGAWWTRETSFSAF